MDNLRAFNKLGGNSHAEKMDAGGTEAQQDIELRASDLFATEFNTPVPDIEPAVQFMTEDGADLIVTVIIKNLGED